MVNPVRFKYRLSGMGLAVGSFGLHDKVVTFELGNVSNPLLDLLTGLSGLILEPSHIWGDDNIAWIEWYGNGSSWRWMLSTADGNHLHILVTESADMFDETSARVVIDGECPINHLLMAIVQELDMLIKQVGLLNYAQQWQKDEFPLTAFLFLKKQLVDKGLWRDSHVPCDNLKLETVLLLS